jgi:hypothetical protein
MHRQSMKIRALRRPPTPAHPGVHPLRLVEAESLAVVLVAQANTAANFHDGRAGKRVYGASTSCKGQS